MIFRRSRATEKHSLFLKEKLAKVDLGSGGVGEWREGRVSWVLRTPFITIDAIPLQSLCHIHTTPSSQIKAFKLSRGITTWGSYNQRFLQPGVLQAEFLATRGLTTRGSYNAKS